MQYTVAIDGVNVSISQLNIVTTVDRTLDYGSFLVRNKQEEAYDVGTIVDIDVTDGTDTLNYHFVIQADDVQKIKGGVYIHAIEIIELTKILEWQTESVRTFTQVIGGLELTLFDVVTRLQLSIPLSKNEDIDSTRIFAIDSDLEAILRDTVAPEFVFSNKNLKEILMEIFDFIGALPRLIRVNNDTVLTADFYNRRNNKITENEFARMERFNINEFGTALDADLKNLFDTYTEVVDPSPTEFKKLYAVGGDFTQDNLIIKTDYPIVDIVSLKVRTDILPFGISNINNEDFFVVENVEIDLTPCILERGLWENLQNVGFLDNFRDGIFRDNTLFFNRFSPDITNLYDVVGAFSNAPVISGKERLEAAIQRALFLSDLTYTRGGVTQKLEFGAMSNYAEIEFQIIYKAQIDSRTEVKRLDTRRIKFDSQAYTGQIDNVVRADRVLDKLFKTQQLLGNAQIMTSERTKQLSDLFSLGDYTDDDYILTTAELQFDKNYVTTKYMWSQNYNKVSEFIGLNSAIRLFPIPNDTYQRNAYIEDVIEIGITEKSNDADMTADGLNTFMNTISNSPSGAFNRPITNMAFDNQVVTSFDPETFIIVKPISAYAGGNSINFHFEFDNPSVAGWQVGVASETVTQNLDPTEDDVPWWSFQGITSAIRNAWQDFIITPIENVAKSVTNILTTASTITAVIRKPIVNGVYYVDDNGFVGEFTFHLIDGFSVDNSAFLPIVAKSDLGTDLISATNYVVFKDAREELALTYALHVLPEPHFEKTFIVGRYLVERNNLVKAISETPNQFEVFTSTEPYNVHENLISRPTDAPSAVTYSITGTQGNALTLSQDITEPVWGIRKISTRELVLVVNQEEATISTVYFNARDRKSDVIYPSQTVVVVPPVKRPNVFGVSPGTTDSVVNLFWQDPNSPLADDYELGRSIDLLNWTSEVVTGSAVQVTGLDPATSYTFRLRARIGVGFSEYIYTTVTTLNAPLPAPQNLSLFMIGARRIRATWDAVEDASLYVVSLSTQSNFATVLSTVTTTRTIFVFTELNTSGIDFNTEHFVRVRASRTPEISDPTDASITTLTMPRTFAPTIIITNKTETVVSFRIINRDSSTAVLFVNFADSFSSANNIGFAGPGEAITGSLNYTTETTLFAVAQAINKLGSETTLNEFNPPEPDEPPNNPTILMGTDGLESRVNPLGGAFNVITFRYALALVRVDGFFIERNPDLDGNNSFGLLSELIPPLGRNFVGTGNDEYRFADQRVASGQSYTYRVRAINRLGVGISIERSVTTLVTVPAAPSGVTAGNVIQGGNGEGVFTLTWQRNSTDEDGFIIERKLSTQGVGSYIEVGGTSKAQTSLTITIIGPPNTTYDFRVIAYNENGNSTPSASDSVFII